MPRQSKRRPSSKPASKPKSAPRDRSPKSKPAPKPEPESPFTSRRDERGVRYPGDWNNPLDGLTRGCF